MNRVSRELCYHIDRVRLYNDQPNRELQLVLYEDAANEIDRLERVVSAAAIFRTRHLTDDKAGALHEFNLLTDAIDKYLLHLAADPSTKSLRIRTVPEVEALRAEKESGAKPPTSFKRCGDCVHFNTMACGRFATTVDLLNCPKPMDEACAHYSYRERG